MHALTFGIVSFILSVSAFAQDSTDLEAQYPCRDCRLGQMNPMTHPDDLNILNRIMDRNIRGLGLYPSETAPVPDAVRRAARSTFRIALPAGNLIAFEDLIPGRTLSQAIAVLEANTSIAPVERAVYLHQLRQCARTPSQPCRLREDVRLGTAFVSGDGFELHSAFHVVQESLQGSPAIQSGLEALPLFVFDDHDRQVADPSDLTVRIGNFDRNALQQLDQSAWPDRSTDWVRLTSSRRLAEPIRIANSAPLPRDPLFVAGFSSATNDRAHFGVPDSDGTRRQVSRGEALSPRDVYRTLDWSVRAAGEAGLGSLQGDIIRSTAKVLSYSSDGGPGASGGPVLNSRGEAVAIHVARFPRSNRAESLAQYGIGSPLVGSDQR